MPHATGVRARAHRDRARPARRRDRHALGPPRRGHRPAAHPAPRVRRAGWLGERLPLLRRVAQLARRARPGGRPGAGARGPGAGRPAPARRRPGPGGSSPTRRSAPSRGSPPRTPKRGSWKWAGRARRPTWSASCGRGGWWTGRWRRRRRRRVTGAGRSRCTRTRTGWWSCGGGSSPRRERCSCGRWRRRARRCMRGLGPPRRRLPRRTP